MVAGFCGERHRSISLFGLFVSLVVGVGLTVRFAVISAALDVESAVS